MNKGGHIKKWESHCCEWDTDLCLAHWTNPASELRSNPISAWIAALIAFFLATICATEGSILSVSVPLYLSRRKALIADGFFHPASVEKIDAAVRVTDDEMRVWSYGNMRTSDNSVDLIPDYRMDANFRGRQSVGMSSSLEDLDVFWTMNDFHLVFAIWV